MSLLKIIKVPDPILKKISRPILDIDKKIKKLAFDMLETMYYNSGIGLAAIQIGIDKRLIVLDIQEDEKLNPLIMINPEFKILDNKNKSSMQEGCLSVPNQTILIERPKKIEVNFIDIDGKKQNFIANDLLAICIQHEIDHLNGITILDKEYE